MGHVSRRHQLKVGRKRFIQELAQGSVGAEVGVWLGSFSHVFLEVVKPRRLYLVDPWKFRPDRPYSWYGGQAGRGVVQSQADMDDIYERLLVKFKNEIAAGTVMVIRDASPAALEAIPDGELDWMYIDGDHTYEGVRGDLHMAARKVKPGGIIAGDDYDFCGWWEDGVTRAVDEYVKDTGIEFARLGHNQYILRT